MSVSIPENETTAPKTVAELTANLPNFPEFDPNTEFGVPQGQTVADRNQYIRELTYALEQEGWNPLIGRNELNPLGYLGVDYSYSSAGAQPVATKPNPNNPGTFFIRYSDGTMREDSYSNVSRGGGVGAGGMGGRSYSGAGGFEGAAAQFAMGGGGSPAGRAARDAAILLARQYGFDASFFSQIENLLYEGISEDSLTLALRQTDAYKKRFAANEARVKKGLPALSEAEYLNMEQLYRQELRAAGLPPAFYDDLNDFKTYIENDISYNEFVSRVGLAKRASISANPEVKKQLKDLYGVGDSDLVGYFLNPEKTTTLLQRQFNVAQTAGALSKSGFGTAMAEELTTSVLGGSSETLNYAELEKSAQTAAAFRPLSGQVLGGERGAVSEADLLRGVVAQDVKSAQEIQKEQQRRLAEYQSGGSLAQAQQGIVGLRSAAR